MIHDCTRLHSTGSHKGSSSEMEASKEKIINKPRRYKKPSPKVNLTAVNKLVEVVLKQLSEK
jgi:hypothetical protein